MSDRLANPPSISAPCCVSRCDISDCLWDFRGTEDELAPLYRCLPALRDTAPQIAGNQNLAHILTHTLCEHPTHKQCDPILFPVDGSEHMFQECGSDTTHMVERRHTSSWGPKQSCLLVIQQRLMTVWNSNDVKLRKWLSRSIRNY